MKKIFFLAVVFFIPIPAHACTIPVFRYALEKWDLTPYEIVIFTRGGLTADVKKTVDKWSKPGKANVEFTFVDLDTDTLDAKMQKLWDRQKNPQTPWMVVRYPQPKADHFTMWAGPAMNANLLSILDSPMRQTILNDLKRGVSSVFVLLKSGDEKADKAAYSLTLAELKSMEAKIKLPEQSKDGPQMKLPLPLKVSLPLLVLDRNQPGEAMFIKLLLETEADLDEVKGPILFPVFGRGRVLGSLTGKELNEEQIREVTKFLCRECSCQVKELNPGIDMLLAANWDDIFNKMFDSKEPPPADAPKVSESPTGTKVEIDRPNLAVTLDEKSGPTIIVEQQPTVETPRCCVDYCPLCENWLYIAIGGAGILVVGTGGWLGFTLLRK